MDVLTENMVPVALIATIVTSLVILMYRQYSKLHRGGIPGPTPVPFLGHIHITVSQGFDKMDKKWEEEYGKMYGYYQGLRPNVAISDPEILKKIFVKHFTNFTNRPSFGNLPKLLENSVFFMRGKTWKRTRNIMTPTFSSGKLKNMVPIINRCASVMTDILLSHAGESVVVRKYFGQFTMETITATAFGLDIDSQRNPDNPFLKHMGLILTPSKLGRIGFILSALVPGLGRILYKIGITGWPRASVEFYEDTGKALIEDRKKNKAEYNDFLYLLLNAEMDIDKSQHIQNGLKIESQANTGPKKDTGLRLSDDEVNGQAFVFFLAGYETTSSLLRYAAYTLAMKPEFDEKLWNEINEHIGMDDPTYDTINQLKYMEQFIYEVLRFYPPVPRLTRETFEDIEIDGKLIPKGTVVAVPVWSIHHNEQYYPEPETFNPERFPADKKISPDSTTFLAFGAGPRHCIGTRLAIIEAKIALVYLLRKVKFVKSEKTQETLELSHIGLLRPKQPIEVLIERR